MKVTSGKVLSEVYLNRSFLWVLLAYMVNEGKYPEAYVWLFVFMSVITAIRSAIASVGSQVD